MASKSSVSRSRTPSPRRRSNRIAGRGGRRVDRGQTHFDLTQTSEDSQGQSPRSSSQNNPEESPNAPRPQSEETNVSRRGMSGLTLPIPTDDPHKVLKMYEKLVQRNVREDVKLFFLREKGYANELRLIQAVQTTEKPSTRTERVTDKGRSKDNLKEDDENIYRNFEVRMGIAAVARNTTGKLFRSKEHKAFFNRLLDRGIMNHRVVDFEYLDAAEVNLRECFEMLQMDKFCTDSAAVYPELTAYFYSNLTFLSPDRMQFSVNDRFYELSSDILADIIKVERGAFRPIDVSYETVSKFLTNSVRATITYPFLTSARTILHKIIISCIRPKASSKTDVSKFEAKLMWAIEKGVLFSLPHTIILHMYRIVAKEKGQLPYGALVTRIFEHLKIDIPKRFCTKTLPTMAIDMKMINKMRLKDVAETWRRKERELARAETAKRKGKELAAAEPSSKRRRQLLLVDEEDEEESISAILANMRQSSQRMSEPEEEINTENILSTGNEKDDALESEEDPEEEEESESEGDAEEEGEEDQEKEGEQGQNEASPQGEHPPEIDIPEPAASSGNADYKKVIDLLTEIRNQQIAMETSFTNRLETLEKTVNQCIDRIEKSASDMEDFTLVRTPSKKSS